MSEPTSREAPIGGTVAPGFEAVREAFARNFAAGLEVGAAVAVYHRGRPVVDLWGGHVDAARTRPWERDTVSLVYSVTKGFVATLFNLMHQAGEVDLDRAVAHYWPEFAAEGKGGITVRQLLAHQAGLPLLDPPLPRETILGAPREVAAALAAQRPLWQPGTRHGYHALTFGWLTGELILRITGRTLGTVLAERITGPLGLDFHVGFPREGLGALAPLVDGTPDPDDLAKIADPTVRAAVERIGAAMADPASLLSRVITTNGTLATPDAATWNDPVLLEGEQPAGNGVGNARAVARLYAACMDEIDGIRLFSAPTLEQARREQGAGPDEVLLGLFRYGSGYQLARPAMPMLGEGSFGHAGIGGAIGFADPESGMAFGYTQNLLSASFANERRARNLIAAVGQSLSAG